MPTPSSRATLAKALAAALLAGPWDPAALVGRAREALDREPPWLGWLAGEAGAAFSRRPGAPDLAAFVVAALDRVPAGEHPDAPRVPHWVLAEPPVPLHPAGPRQPWPVPRIDDVAALAALLGLELGQLDWLADVKGLERRVRADRLRNYRYLWLARAGGPPRLLERPKARLKAAQRAVLRAVLDHVPPHDAAHGFTRGRSVRTHAERHLGRRVVLRLDLEDFFAAVRAGRVFGILRSAGLPDGVAHVVCALCTNVVPQAEWARVARPADPALVGAFHRLGRRLATPHLPQGAPTSPALANLAAFTLDRRVAGLAAVHGATYTRYADDLVLSGGPELLRAAAGVRETVARIARDEGFLLNAGKTRVMTDAGRQTVGGVVVNVRPNVARQEYDRLKAVLHNAVHDGPGDLDPAVLRGRIAWVASLHPGRGTELERRFARVAWEPG